jgi:hypothetical protein
MQIRSLIVISLAMAAACTANDGTERSSFYGNVVATGGGTGTGGTSSGCQSDAECAATERCFAGECYTIVNCSTSLDCYNNAPSPVNICDTSTGQCVLCVTNADCSSLGLGSSCVDNNCI